MRQWRWLTVTPTNLEEVVVTLNRRMAGLEEIVDELRTQPLQVQLASQLHSGSGVPATALGANGDFYFRDDGAGSTALYYKASGSWSAIA